MAYVLCKSLLAKIVAVNKLRYHLGSVQVFSKSSVVCCRDAFLSRTSECSFQIGPVLVVEKPFTVNFNWDVVVCYLHLVSFSIFGNGYIILADLQINSGLMTPTMKRRRDRVVARYNDQISSLYK
ncbi:hypothetical protein IFM89_030889 [Coptis chinensis]|uniref:Uncharacterized protein n=1 Tax=Coptis chinensis TaxID=261450 RepID=A0A835HZN5_9MAGN|nr:hypothetical protein IFM89_030889 [Coptis chinensis]